MTRTVVTRALRDPAPLAVQTASAVAYGPLTNPPNPNGTSAGSQTVDITYPVDTALVRPCLVYFVYGGWETVEPENIEPILQVQVGPRLGYVTFIVDYRVAGSNESGTANSTIADSLADAQLFLSWLATHAATYGGDVTRVAIIGASAGGHLAEMVALQGSAIRPAVVVSWSGVGRLDFKSDFTHQLGPPYISPITFATGYATPAASVGSANDWYNLSPYYLVTQGKVQPSAVPYLYIQHGDADVVVDYWTSQTLDAALTAAGIAHGYTLYAGVSHINYPYFLTDALAVIRTHIGQVRRPGPTRGVAARVAV